MPYIKPEERNQIDPVVDQLVAAIRDLPFCDRSDHCGRLNYAISTLISDVMALGLPSYKDINAAMGVLECVKLELYRRLAAPYEDKKLAENGDVF